jgi:hypothetical protein
LFRSAAGTLSVGATTASTSTTTGSLVNSGGFGNAGAAFFGGEINYSNNIGSFGGITLANANTGGSAGVQISFLQNGTTERGRIFAGGNVNGLTLRSIPGGTSGDVVFNATGVSIPHTTATSIQTAGGIRSTSATGGIGYGTGAGGAVTQGTSRTTGVTLNNVCGAITLFTAAGSATWQSFTVTNSVVAATDTIIVNQRSGTDLYMMHVTAVAAGSFRISFATTGGTTSEAPVFNFAVIDAVSS